MLARVNKHKASHCHKEAVLKTMTLLATTGNVVKMLYSQLAKQRLERRKCFLELLSNVFLLRQGLVFHGYDDEADLNFIRLNNFRC